MTSGTPIVIIRVSRGQQTLKEKKMDDLRVFSFAGNVQSDELTQDGSDQDWQEYSEWLETQEQNVKKAENEDLGIWRTSKDFSGFKSFKFNEIAYELKDE